MGNIVEEITPMTQANKWSRRAAVSALLASLSVETAAARQAAAPIKAKEPLKITRLETFLVKPRWVFLKIHTNAGITGLGEPLLEGRALTIQTAIKEIEPYLIGKDPRPIQHHWQAIYRHAFYRGGPLLTSALSGIDQALWDIKGKALGVPVYELLGGPTRNRIRVYAHGGGSDPARIKALLAQGFTAFKTGPARRRKFPKYVETPAEVQYAGEKLGEFRKLVGDNVDIGVDFHGAVSPAHAKMLIKALEPYNPMFIEEPCQAQNHDIMAEIARFTHLPIATGERVFTSGVSARSSKGRRQRSSSPISATPAESAKSATSPPWPKPITPRSRPTIPWDRSRSPPASNWPRRSPTSSSRNRFRSARATSSSPSRSAKATSNYPPRPALAWRSTTMPSPIS